MQRYLDEELVFNREDIAIAYVRIGPKSQELFSGRAKVLTFYLLTTVPSF